MRAAQAHFDRPVSRRHFSAGAAILVQPYNVVALRDIACRYFPLPTLSRSDSYHNVTILAPQGNHEVDKFEGTERVDKLSACVH